MMEVDGSAGRTGDLGERSTGGRVASVSPRQPAVTLQCCREEEEEEEKEEEKKTELATCVIMDS